MPHRIVQVDAFTDRPFTGNPAAVCLLAAPAEERWMQAVAREMNLSETAFLHPEADGWRLRWFTPAVEVDLCGHATLASAHVLWEEGRVAPGATVRFSTRSGLLTARRAGGWIEMDFPAEVAAAAQPPAELRAALGLGRQGIEAVWIGKSRLDYLVELASEAAVRALRPDLALLRTVPVRGVVVTAPSTDPAFDFVSRFFAPAVGVDEDPVTGSAHCSLGPHWAGRLGRAELTGYQASARGGVVRVRTAGARVLLAGQAVTVLEGALR
ncbi:MAG TPA: PhzF family phenazine biosynthesis protein [Gemmatimonadales bacterium]|nr:PhzF family phenazine biosynthesis protein [Gemmatimonadales bacterium]